MQHVEMLGNLLTRKIVYNSVLHENLLNPIDIENCEQGC